MGGWLCDVSTAGELANGMQLRGGFVFGIEHRHTRLRCCAFRGLQLIPSKATKLQAKRGQKNGFKPFFYADRLGAGCVFYLVQY